MVSLFCRHNRFTADCPICSRGTVLDSPATPSRRSSKGSTRGPRSVDEQRSGGAGAHAGSSRRTPSRGVATYRGPYASAGPYERDGTTYEVRLERVPGGLRLAEWSAAQLCATAPVLAAGDLRGLLARAAESGALEPDEHAALAATLDAGPPAADAVPSATDRRHGASAGRSGELQEELRVERCDGDRLRVARWVLRPGTGWDLLDAPTMLPARRYAEALADAARRGLLAP